MQMESAELTKDEVRRYARHLLLPEVGPDGQKKLKNARVLVVGAGGLGSPVALYLAASGVGTIGLVDFDIVDESNLQRQVLYSVKDVGRSKLTAARDRLLAINPDACVQLYEVRLSSANAWEIVSEYDVIVDGSDNFATRYLVSDACVLLKKPHVYGSVFRFEGQVSVFDATQGPCYRCLYPEPPLPDLVQNCAEAGVLGVLPGTIGSIQANETLKFILKLGESLVGRLLLFDAMAMRFEEVRFGKNTDCPICGAHPTITSLLEYEAFCNSGTKPTIEKRRDGLTDMTVQELKKRLDNSDDVFLLDVRTPEEVKYANIGGNSIPLHLLPLRINELDRTKEIVVYCHHGARSAQAVSLLRRAGFGNVHNLSGGIDAWSREIDPEVPKY